MSVREITPNSQLHQVRATLLKGRSGLPGVKEHRPSMDSNVASMKLWREAFAADRAARGVPPEGLRGPVRNALRRLP